MNKEKCQLCQENEGTVNVWLKDIRIICQACSDELGKDVKFEEGSKERFMKKLQEDRKKIDKKLIKNLKKMSDKQLLLEHDEITSRPIERFMCGYLDELNKEIKLRNLNINDYDDFNDKITVQDFKKYIENNKVDDDYTFADYKRDVLRMREEVIIAGNKLVEKYNG